MKTFYEDWPETFVTGMLDMLRALDDLTRRLYLERTGAIFDALQKRYVVAGHPEIDDE